MRLIISLVLAFILMLSTASGTLSGDTIRGTASNYAGTAGFIGQPTVALPYTLGGRYTGHINGYVTICADYCAIVPVVDYCQCYWNSTNRRIVDLNYQAWALITDKPLSEGLIQVTIKLGITSHTRYNIIPDTAMTHVKR